MSRTQAAGKRNRKTGQIIAPGRVIPEMKPLVVVMAGAEEFDPYKD